MNIRFLRTQTLVGIATVLGLCGLAATETSANSAPAGVTLTLGPGSGPLTPGTVATFTACGNPGDFALFMIDVVPGTTSLPYLGGFDIGLAQSSFFTTVFRILDSNGKSTVGCGVRCDDVALFNEKIYAQVATFNRNTRQLCVSNVGCLTWDDDGTCSGQGCTPGYWKQPHHFDAWTAPYDPTDLFSEHFEDAFPGKTLQEVLSIQGGMLHALGRHTVAALLNAASPDVTYPLATPQDVIDAFDAVYPGADGNYELLKDELEQYNEAGCPLN